MLFRSDQVVWRALPPPPPPSHYAEIGDVAAVPYLTDALRDLYARYLAKTGAKALVLGVPGGAFAYYDGRDPFGQAMVNCREQVLICEPYAIGDQVVWVPPPSLPAATNFAPLQDAEAVPFLSPEGRTGYRTFLAASGPRAFAIAPDGAWASGAGGKEIARVTLAKCSQFHKDCKLYAIDDRVVWQ